MECEIGKPAPKDFKGQGCVSWQLNVCFIELPVDPAASQYSFINPFITLKVLKMKMHL